MMFVGPSLGEACHCKLRAGGSPLCHVFCGVVVVVNGEWTFVSVGGGSSLRWFVPDGYRSWRSKWRERGERERT
jgi:hypothetical protein